MPLLHSPGFSEVLDVSKTNFAWAGWVGLAVAACHVVGCGVWSRGPLKKMDWRLEATGSFWKLEATGSWSRQAGGYRLECLTSHTVELMDLGGYKRIRKQLKSYENVLPQILWGG